MTDDTKAGLAPFAAEGFPTFESTAQAPQEASEAAPSPTRKSRRSRRTAAAPSPVSSAKSTKRKYTRRTVIQPGPVAQVAAAVERGERRRAGFDPTLTMPYGSELELVTEIVTKLRALDAKTRARVMAAIGRLL